MAHLKKEMSVCENASIEMSDSAKIILNEIKVSTIRRRFNDIIHLIFKSNQIVIGTIPICGRVVTTSTRPRCYKEILA